MNKKVFIEKLANALNYEEEKCIIINNILEDNFFLSKSNKDKIIEAMENKLNVEYEEATHIYEVAIGIIKDELKEKIKHPFKSQD